MNLGVRRLGFVMVLAVAVVAAGCSRAASSAPATGATATGASPSASLVAAASADPGASPSAVPLPSDIAYAVHQRETFGLRSDLAWVEQVAADPTARIVMLDIPLTPAEEQWMESRQASYDEVVAAVSAYAATVPDEFGGLYIDQPNSRVVALFTGHLDQHRQAILDQLGKSGPLDVQQVTYTDAELRALQDRISADWDWLRSINAQATGVGVYTMENRVVLSISSTNPDAPALVLAHYGLPASELRVSSDGTGIALMPQGWADVSVKVATGVSAPPSGWTVDMTGDGPGSWGGEVGWGVQPGMTAKVPATVGGWTVKLLDDSQKVVASGHVTIVAGKHVALVLIVK